MAAHGPTARGWSRRCSVAWLRAETARWTAPTVAAWQHTSAGELRPEATLTGPHARLRADRLAGLAMGFGPTQFWNK
jgi:hypothetical protein